MSQHPPPSPTGTWETKSLAELKAEGLDTLGAIITKHPGAKLWVDIAAIDANPAISDEDKIAFRELTKNGLAEGWAEIVDARGTPVEKENT